MDIEEIRDRFGNLRKLGSLQKPAGFKTSFQLFEDKFDIWDDATIRRVITDPSRVPARSIFGPDWILDQKSHGSCNGFAEAGAYGKARYKRGVMDKKKFSGAFAYSLMNGGQDNGSMLEDGMKNLLSVGIAEEQYAGWDDIYPSRWKPGARENAAKHRGRVCYAAGSIQGLKTGVAKGFLAVVAVHAGGAFQRLNDLGIAGVDNGPGNHSVHSDDICVVGGDLVFDMANSWGLQYGRNGRAYLHPESFSQTFRNHMFYLVGSTEEKD